MRCSDYNREVTFFQFNLAAGMLRSLEKTFENPKKNRDDDRNRKIFDGAKRREYNAHRL